MKPENINHPVVGATNSFDVRITHSLDYEVCFSDSWIHNNHVSTTTLSTTVYSETFQSVETIIIDANEEAIVGSVEVFSFFILGHS